VSLGFQGRAKIVISDILILFTIWPQFTHVCDTNDQPLNEQTPVVVAALFTCGVLIEVQMADRFQFQQHDMIICIHSCSNKTDG